MEADDTITHDVKMTSPANLEQLKQWIVVQSAARGMSVKSVHATAAAAEAGYE